jgi:hypothetical protein
VNRKGTFKDCTQVYRVALILTYAFWHGRQFGWCNPIALDIVPRRMRSHPLKVTSRKLNRDQKQARKVGQLATFVRQYARKAQRGVEPNDRRYDRSVEAAMNRMSADELDRLLREDEDDQGRKS